jgi:hypothetical protein
VDLSVYIAGEEEDPFQTEPFLTGDLNVVPDTTYTARFSAKGDERIVELFSGNEVNIAASLEFDPYGDENVTGTLEMTRFEIVVTGKGHVGSS